MATELVPFESKLFVHHPSKPSKAQQGLCSWCWRQRRADYAIITSDRARWAVCRLHAQLFRLNRQRADIRAMFDLPDDSIVKLMESVG